MSRSHTVRVRLARVLSPRIRPVILARSNRCMTFKSHVGCGSRSNAASWYCQGLFDHAESRPYFFYSMAAFRMLFADIHHFAGRSDSLGINTCRQKSCAARFCAGALDRSFQLHFRVRQVSACCQAASSGPRSPLSVLTDPVICQYYLGPVTRIFISLDCSFELRFRPGQIQAHFVKLNPPDRDRHCWFSPIR
jgi:hypothetical protein